MQKGEPTKNLTASHLAGFSVKLTFWCCSSLAIFFVMAGLLVGAGVHTAAGRKILLCPLVDAAAMAMNTGVDVDKSLKTIGKEWRHVPHPSADWAYLPFPRLVVPVPIQIWSKKTENLSSQTLLSLTSPTMNIRLERTLEIPRKLQLRRLQEALLADPALLLDPSQLAESLSLVLGSLDTTQESHQKTATRDAFRRDLTQKCTPKAPWQDSLATLSLVREKIAAGAGVIQAWRNVTPGSLTLVSPGKITVLLSVDQDVSGSDQPTNTPLTLTYSNLSESMMGSVMQQIGLIRDTGLADRDLPANFFRSPEDASMPPLANGDRSLPRL